MNKRAKILFSLFIIALVLAVVLPVTVGTERDCYDASLVYPITRQELTDFLNNTPVHNRTYDSIRYNCINFALDLWHEAYLKGIDAFIVIIDTGFIGHVVVGFYSTDEVLCTWGSRGNNRTWFMVEPNISRPIYKENKSVGITAYSPIIHVSGFVYGNDALRLYKAMHEGLGMLPGCELAMHTITYRVGKILAGEMTVDDVIRRNMGYVVGNVDYALHRSIEWLVR